MNVASKTASAVRLMSVDLRFWILKLTKVKVRDPWGKRRGLGPNGAFRPYEGPDPVRLFFFDMDPVSRNGAFMLKLKRLRDRPNSPLDPPRTLR